MPESWCSFLWGRLAILALVGAPVVAGATLRPEAVDGWVRYVEATEARRARELESLRGFLAVDFEADATARRRVALDGSILVDRVETIDDDGRALDVPAAMLHHWRGVVFVPGATTDVLLAGLRTSRPGAGQEDVLESRMLARDGDRLRVFLKLQRRKIVTVVYNTEHDVRLHDLGWGRAASASVATRIAEVRDAGTPAERELEPGHDRGFLWRLNAYWRYVEVPGGVLVECESLTLSRDVPAVVRFLVMPMVRDAARESMTRTLASFRDRFAAR